MDLKVLRFICNISQEQFAALTGLWQPRLSLIENDKLRPSKNEQRKINDFVRHSGIDIDFIDFVERKRGMEYGKNSY